MNAVDLAKLAFDQDGLIVAIVQDAATGTVLMVASMNREALERTIDSREAHFWSRSRQALWRKGETSGNVMHVESIQADCDGDALLLSVTPGGPACHTGQRSCFSEPATLLDRLEATIHQRNLHRPNGSYSAKLFEEGRPSLLRKFGEEAIEVMVATDHEGEQDLVHEVADLWFHSMLLLEERGANADAVLRELEARQPS